MSTTSATTATHGTGSSAVRRAWGAVASVPWWIWAIVGVAIIPRLAMIGYGLPYELDPDERLFVDSAWQLVESGTPDKLRFGVPAATIIDLLAGIYATYGAVGTLVGAFDSIAGAGDAYRADVTHFFVIGRLVSVLSGLAVVLMTYAVLRELRVTAFWAAVAALMVALSFPMIQFSSIVRPDMLMTACLLAVVLVMLRVLERPSVTAFIVAGVLLGLSAASKYRGHSGSFPSSSPTPSSWSGKRSRLAGG